MTREEMKDFLPIAQAWTEGKTIQCNVDGIWIDADINLELSLGDISKYRIKPEQKFRPFKSAEECWQEMQNHHPIGWIKDKNEGFFCFIGSAMMPGEYGNFLIRLATTTDTFTATYMFENYMFSDGTPFGIKEE